MTHGNDLTARQALAAVMSKRDGGRLTEEDIATLVGGYMHGDVGEPLMAAFLMAAVTRGLDTSETSALCQAMVASGDRMTYPGLGRPLVDKHSTGGVGDKTSLLLAPMLAAVGAAVPMMSGRGLGHTGGTLDKLEALAGFTVDLDPGRIAAQLADVGAVICAATANLAPADRRLYALRDATGTVPSLGLIAASIMSKKIAEGTDGLVLDVKYGNGAFLPDPADARHLAETMVALGHDAGLRISALVTDMSAPLGTSVGNALEIAEIRAALDGDIAPDLLELTAALGREMARLAGIDDDPVATLYDGRARERWERMLAAQGAPPDARLEPAHHQMEVAAMETGVVTAIDAKTVGEIAWHLGAGRARPGDPIDHRVGIVFSAKPGTRVRSGDQLAVIHASSTETGRAAAEALAQAITIGEPDVTVPSSLVAGTVGVPDSDHAT
jgi:thymidine phosphorylase